MDLIESSVEGKELKSINRTKCRTLVILTFTSIYIFASIFFAVMNFQGYRKQKSTKVVFNTADCPNTSEICEVEVEINNFEGPIFVYLSYRAFYTGYYIFSRSQSLANVYGDFLQEIDNTECYPVHDAMDFKEALQAYKMTKIPEWISNAKDTDNVFPCGLKAALYSNIDDLEIVSPEGTPVELSRIGLVNKKYTDKIQTSENQWTDVSDERFLSWLLPQPPITGTIFIIGRTVEPLNGKYTFKLTNNFPVLQNENFEKSVIVKSGKYSFTNQFLAVVSCIGVVFSLILFIVYLISLNKK